MKEQTLDELWKALDGKSRLKLLHLLANELFVGADTVTAWRRGARAIPVAKRTKLASLLERRYLVKLKTN